jgi:hypothetical protein
VSRGAKLGLSSRRGGAGKGRFFENKTKKNDENQINVVGKKS